MSALTEFALRWPRFTLLFACMLSAFGAIAAARAPINAGAYACVGDEHPAVREFETFIERYGGGYPLIVARSCGHAGDPCDSVSLLPAFVRVFLRLRSRAKGAACTG